MKYICGPNNTEIDIDLPEGQNKNILFGISGGADSAILLYLLAKLNYELKTNHNIIPFTVPRPDGGANYSPKIIDWINNKLHLNIPLPLIEGNGTLPHNIVVKVVIRKLMGSGKYDFLYIAENKIPPVEIEGLAPKRAAQPKFDKAALPFWGITKDCIIDLYYRENIEELLTLSHTCTELITGRCSNCFQCNERKWAFSTLNKTDPGNK